MVQLSSNDPFEAFTDDFIIREILSRVGTIESMISLSLVSKKFQTLCRFAPIVDFEEITKEIVDYLDKFFAFRTNLDIKSEFQRFSLRMRGTRYTPNLGLFYQKLIQKWFQDALSLNAQELILQTIPLYHDNRHSLAVLKLPLFPLKHLRILRLERVPVALERSFGEWVSNCCVSLEELHLKDMFICPSKFNITSSSLRVLKIDGHFWQLDVSAPKLVTLDVMWNLLIGIHSDPHLSLRVSSAPNLENFLLANWDTPISIDYLSSDDETSFPSLQSASIVFPEIANLSLDSLENLFRDISQTKSLLVTETLLQKLSLHGSHFPTSLDKLENLHVCVEGSDERWIEQTGAIISFLRKAPSLKIFTITTHDELWYDGRNQISKFIQSLVNNISKFGIARPALCLDANTVKIELSRGENETALVESIIRDAPSDKKFIISYPC